MNPRDALSQPEDETPRETPSQSRSRGDVERDSLAGRLLEKYGPLLCEELSLQLSMPASDSSAVTGDDIRDDVRDDIHDDIHDEVGADAGAAHETSHARTDESLTPANGEPPRRRPLFPSDLFRYDIGVEIARGGMGAILEAWDRDLARPLAMKVLLEDHNAQVSASTVQRFVREARITGQLDHPGIVPVHELGIDDSGRVYFTMRLLRGKDLGKVFDNARQRREGWNRTRVLEVFLKICDTMAYAHSRGVVHRDLKPLNVMVGDFGEVSILDWGLAKVWGTTAVATDDASDSTDALTTLTGTVLGTPSYMAPEQAEGRVEEAEPRVDVYSLGAILYTLVAGRPPYMTEGTPVSSHEILCRVRAGAPPELRGVAPEVSDGLARICERAMARQPEQRYATAADIASALREHLESERLAAEETQQLRRQLSDSLGVSEFLKGLFRVETVADASKPVSVVEILERGSVHIDQELADQPAMRGALHTTLGDVHNSIGTYAQAIPHLEQGVRIAREHLSATAAEQTLAHRLTGLAQVLYETGEYARAEELLKESIAIQRQLGEIGEPMARALSSLCTLCWNTGRLHEAMPLAQESIALRRALPDEERLAISLVELGVIVDSLGRFDEAEQLYAEALEIRTRVLGPRHAMVATILINLGSLNCYRENFAEAVRHYSEALDIRREALGPKHPKVALALVNLGYALGKVGELDRSEDVHRECIALRLEVLGPDHPNLAHSYDNLAAVLVQKGELVEAEELLDRAIEICNAKGGEQHPMHAWIAATMALLRERQGRIDEAVAALEAAVAHDVADGEPLHAHSVDHMHELARLFLRLRRPAEAFPLLQSCLEVYERQFRARDPIVLNCRASLEQAQTEVAERG